MKLLVFITISILLSAFIYAEEADSLIISGNTKVVVDSIEIRGNETTEEFIILREMTFEEGDTVTAKMLDYNRERVYSLGLFNFVKVYLIEKEEDHVICVIDVKESWYVYPIPFLNFKEKSWDKVSYGINLRYRNFRGRNETINAKVSLGHDPNYSLSYFNPVLSEDYDIFMHVFTSLGKAGNNSDRAERLHGSDFEYNTINGGFRVGKRIDQFNSASLMFNYNYIEAPAENYESITASGRRVDAFPELGLVYQYDTRDLAQFANDGLYIRMQYKHLGFEVNDIDYNVFTFDFREYRTILDFIAKWRVNYRHTYGKLVPYYDHSFLGLGEFVRGHRDDKQEGNNYILASVEAAYPVVDEFDLEVDLPLIPTRLTSARIAIHLTTFADAGSAYDNEVGLNFNNFYSGWGFGLSILFLPYNALRLEYAFDEYRNGEFILGTGFSF